MAKKNNPVVKKTTSKPKTGLPNLKIYIDEQGRIVKNYDATELNEFLNQHVPDSKLDEE